ncbi:hypothetical protein [Novosphingobium sp.]|uniref:hypothetical protein n=1 Tax=Novosphingobium sp. TaxID=1874826 RepID=UPI003D12813F
MARVQARRVLDIASSHGLYGIECAQKFPEASDVALDWPGVIPFTKKSVERAA